MKKIFTLVLVLSLIVFGSSMAASAANISIAADNLGRGSGDSTVVENDDGSITTQTANISFYLSDPIKANETVTVHVKGSSDGDFRVWLIDEQEVTNSDIYQISLDDFTSGDFDKTFNLTATAEATEIFFKAPTWDTTLNNLTITELSITAADGATDDIDEAVVETADEEVTKTEAPKTGVSSYAMLYMVLMAITAMGYSLLKKKAVLE